MEKKKSLNIAMLGHKHMMSREGGVEIVVNELSTRMAKRGHSVICYDRSTNHISGAEIDKRIDFEGVKIVPVWTINQRGLAAMTSSITASLKAAKSKADVVHFHAEGPAAMCWLPKRKGKRVIVTVHGLDWARSKWGGLASKYIKFGEKQAVKNADEIIVLSRRVQQYFRNTYGRDTVFIPNGVCKPEIVPADLIRKQWGLEKNNYILFLGRIVPEKGLQYLVEAYGSIHTDKKLVITGGSSDTSKFVNELKSMASENVIFTGFQQGRVLAELYSNAYVYVLPSDLEGMPLGLLEAMSYGNCCIVSDISECTEVVENNAAVFRKSNVQDLKRVLLELLNDEQRVMDYKMKASDFICTKYKWDDVVDRTLELYYGK